MRPGIGAKPAKVISITPRHPPKYQGDLCAVTGSIIDADIMLCECGEGDDTACRDGASGEPAALAGAAISMRRGLKETERASAHENRKYRPPASSSLSPRQLAVEPSKASCLT